MLASEVRTFVDTAQAKAEGLPEVQKENEMKPPRFKFWPLLLAAWWGSCTTSMVWDLYAPFRIPHYELLPVSYLASLLVIAFFMFRK